MSKQEYEYILNRLKHIRKTHPVGSDEELDLIIGRCYSELHILYEGRDAAGTKAYIQKMADLQITLDKLDKY